MARGTEFQPAARAAIGSSGAPELRLGAWEGPLDRLLELVHARRVGLARLSILDLVEQFGALFAAAVGGRRLPLNKAGDWLVMAAHLALLRSRLLLPADAAEGVGERREAEALRRRLADREHARRLADWLERWRQLGRDVFARGAAEEMGGDGRAVPTADTAALFRACLAALEREHASGPCRPEPAPLWRVPDALARLRRMLSATPGMAPLERFLPDTERDGPLRRRAALASTLLAALEQERAFGRIGIAAVHPGAPARAPRRSQGRA